MSGFLNRKQKREADRKFRRGKISSQKEVGLPSLLDSFTIFDSTDRVLKAILKGEMSVNDQDQPLFRNNAGELQEVIPSLLRWVETWSFIKERVNDSEFIQMESMLSILHSLNQQELVKHEQIILAIEHFELLRKFYNGLLSNQRELIKTLARSYETSVLIERLEKIKERES